MVYTCRCVRSEVNDVDLALFIMDKIITYSFVLLKLTSGNNFLTKKKIIKKKIKNKGDSFLLACPFCFVQVI